MASKQMHMRMGAVSPVSSPKPTSLLSQTQTTTTPNEDQHLSGMAASPPDYYGTNFTSDYSKTDKLGSRVANTGLAVSHTRTTTHTSNQQNSGGNVAAPNGISNKK